MIKPYKNADLGLLLLRLGVGLVFVVHGWQKWQNLAGTIQFFGSLGLAPLFVYIVAAVELLAGLGLILGVLVGWASLLLAINMVMAIILVKGQMGFVGGYEFDLVLLTSALAAALIGPGKYAIKGKPQDTNSPNV